MASIKTKQPASTREAAAIAAAIERFTADTTPNLPTGEEGMDPWLKAALVEGVNAGDIFGPGHIDDHGIRAGGWS